MIYQGIEEANFNPFHKQRPVSVVISLKLSGKIVWK